MPMLTQADVDALLDVAKADCRFCGSPILKTTKFKGRHLWGWTGCQNFVRESEWSRTNKDGSMLVIPPRPPKGDHEAMRKWCDWVEKQESWGWDNVARLALRVNVAWEREQTSEVGLLPYTMTMRCALSAEHPPSGRVTIRFVLLDSHSDSDVTITNMTTLPAGLRSAGKGSIAIGIVLEWMREVGFTTLRATQVGHPDSARFWMKNGFVRAPAPNPTSDYIRSV
jgi:hypothetical protein